MEYFELQEEILLTLGKLRAKGIEAICAGGAVRELLLGKPHLANDLDIFVHDRPQIINDARHALGGFVFRESCVKYLGMTDVSDMVELNFTGKSVVQVIAIRQGINILERLDFGLCQIGIGASFETHDFITTQAFHQDRRDKTLTLMRCDSFKDAQRSMKRAQKILKKYPDHRLVIPEKFKHLIA